jgi:serine/threonine-protein kinase
MNHPNVVQTYEIGQEGDRYFIAMEYLDGQPYSRVLSRMRAHVPLAMHLRVIADMLTGLHHAHELRDFDGTPLNVVHRDVTPQNVFVTYDGSIKVVDFGIAKALDASAQTRTGVVKGKVAYMSPEQVRGDRLDRRADIFAAGVMLFEAIAGRRMWEELPDVTVVHELMYDRVPNIFSAVPNVPPALARICQLALSPRREERYPTALDMHRDIENFLAQSGLRASARDVGELIAPAFENERQRVRSVIESQLRDVRWTGVLPRATSQGLPAIGAPVSGPYQAQDLHPSLASSSGSVIVPEHPITSPSARVPVAMPPPGPISFAPTAGGAAVPVPSGHAAPQRSFLVPTIVAVVASIAVVGLGIKLLVRSDPPPAPAASASAEPKDAAPDAVKLTVRAKPAEARIYLDGVLLSAGPFEGKVLRSPKPRVVRVEAEHYLPKQEEIALTSDLVLSFDLEKDDKAQPASTTRPAAGTTPGGGRPAPDGPANGSKTRPKHDIDSDSPYKK